MSTVVDQVDQCVQVVIETMRKIECHEQEIARRQEAINIIKGNLSATIAKAAAGLNKNDLHELAYLLYWHTSVPAEAAADLLGVRAGSALIKALGGLPSGDFCLWCKEEFMYTSRTNRAEILWKSRENLGKLCDKCREKYYEHCSSEERKRQEAHANQVAAYKAMPYREYLQTEHWQAVRMSALKRGRYHCQLCNAGGVLDVHHNTYERRGEEQSADVIVLCRGCHGKFHAKEAHNG